MSSKVENDVLAILADAEPGSYVSLTSFYERMAHKVSQGGAFDEQQEVREQIRYVLDQMVLDDLVESTMDGRDYEKEYRLTDHGTYEASGFDSLVVSDAEAEQADKEHDQAVDSANWTGLPCEFTLGVQRQERLVALLSDVERNLDAAGIPNFEKAMARAYIVAARTLAESPEPPADIIWELIGRANQIAGIAALLVAIIALFAAAR